ncbi:MAG: hypothetical protein JNL70_17595 [Saprospiraceae bacterium]|nr:hypothetical protein [Saprospiraceae bacterium]
MLKKHLVAIGLLLSLCCLILATFYYPGGSQADKNAIGFDWANNYLCNLFNEKAVNGAYNPARFMAITGMFLLCVSIALFFINFSKKISIKRDANIIRYTGIGAMCCTFLLITPYHDAMTIFASTFGLLTLFYISVYTFMSKLTFLKYLSALCLIILYLNNYIYYTQQGLAWLPILQKISLLTLITWLLSLEYVTTKEDFLKKA